MIRRAQKLEMSAMDPTPEQIRERSEAIRNTWSPRERARRLRFKQVSWTPPIFAETDLPGLMSSDFDSR